MNLSRLMIFWTIFFLWGWAYMMPAVPVFMFAVWVWENEHGMVWKMLIGTAIVMSFYA